MRLFGLKTLKSGMSMLNLSLQFISCPLYCVLTSLWFFNCTYFNVFAMCSCYFIMLMRVVISSVYLFIRVLVNLEVHTIYNTYHNNMYRTCNPIKLTFSIIVVIRSLSYIKYLYKLINTVRWTWLVSINERRSMFMLHICT